MLGSSVTYTDTLRDALSLAESDKPDDTSQTSYSTATQLRQHLHQIELDVERTFPNHPEFRTDSDDEENKPKCDEDENSETKQNKNGQKLEPLRRVLIALAHAVPEIGYTQGMNFVCGWCLLVLERGGLGSDADTSKHALEECCFWLMKSILQNVLPNYFAPGLAALRHDLDGLDDDFSDVAPDAHATLDVHGLSVKCFCPRWLLCVMVGTAPTEVTLRVWDALMVDAPSVVFEKNQKNNSQVTTSSGSMPSLRFRPNDVLRRCALVLLTSGGRSRAIAVAPGAGEAVDAIRAAGKSVVDVSSFLRRVRDLAPGSKPMIKMKAVIGAVVAGVRVGAISRLGGCRSGATTSATAGATSKASTPQRSLSANDVSSSHVPRPVLTPFGNLLSAMRGTPAREAVKPRVLWAVEEEAAGEAGRGERENLGKRKRSRENQENGIELDGGSCATPSRRRVTGVNAMASYASPAPSPVRSGYGYESPLATRSPLARMR